MPTRIAVILEQRPGTKRPGLCSNPSRRAYSCSALCAHQISTSACGLEKRSTIATFPARDAFIDAFLLSDIRTICGPWSVAPRE